MLRYLLTNDTRLIEHFQHADNSSVVFSSFEKVHINLHSYWFLWDEALPDIPVQLAREKFNIRNGLTLVRCAKNYYDMIEVVVRDQNGLKSIRSFTNIHNDFQRGRLL